MQATGSVISEADGPGLGSVSKHPSIVVDVATSFTYASYQNAVPVIRSIRLEDHTDQHIETCRIELTSSPAFLRPKIWTVDRLVPGDNLQLSDRKVELVD